MGTTSAVHLYGYVSMVYCTKKTWQLIIYMVVIPMVFLSPFFNFISNKF